MLRSEIAGSRVAPAFAADPPQHNRGTRFVKVIASSLRKGNIVELDGKLYVVLNAESFHPGKGTPTTQIDMRRISDGVKISQRYKTTEQVERAYVEDREHQLPLPGRRRLPFHEHRELRPGHACRPTSSATRPPTCSRR